MQFQFSQLTFPENAEVIINDVSWADFERFMDELGDRSSLRIHYNQRSIHLMAPSVGHEMPKVYIGDFIRRQIEHCMRRWACLSCGYTMANS